jgi:hypothetical protein
VINDLHSQLSFKLSTFTPYQNPASSPTSPSSQSLLETHKSNWLSTLDSQILHLNTSLKSLSALHSSSSQPFYDEAELPDEMLRVPLKQMENVVEGAHELMNEVIERLTDTVGEVDGLQKEKSNRERKKHENAEVESVEIEQMLINTVETKETLEKDFDKIEW